MANILDSCTKIFKTKFDNYNKKANRQNIKQIIQRKAEDVATLINQFGLESCMKNKLFVQNLLDYSFYRGFKVNVGGIENVEILDLIVDSNLNFEEILSHNRLSIANLQAKKTGNTLGHILAMHPAFNPENFETLKYGNIEKALKFYASNYNLAQIQNIDGNTIGHLANHNERILGYYKKSRVLSSIKNKKGLTATGETLTYKEKQEVRRQQLIKQTNNEELESNGNTGR